MKYNFNIMALIITVLITVLLISGCDKKDDPKALAKQSYDLSKEILTSAADLDKAEKLTKDAIELSKKVEKLSVSDKVTYNFELARLMKADAEGLLHDVDLNEILDTSEVKGVLDSLKSLF